MQRHAFALVQRHDISGVVILVIIAVIIVITEALASGRLCKSRRRPASTPPGGSCPSPTCAWTCNHQTIQSVITTQS
jgi:hypothetical protein